MIYKALSAINMVPADKAYIYDLQLSLSGGTLWEA